MVGRRTALGVALAALVGCGKSAFEDEIAFEEGASSGTGTVSFASKVDGDAFVRWGLADSEALTNVTPTAPAADGKIVVLGLPTGTEVSFEVVVDDGGKERVSERIDARISAPARNVIQFQQTVWNEALSCDPGGHVLFSYIKAEASGVGIVDRDGNYVFSLDWPAEEQVARVRPGRDGKSLLFNTADAAKVEDVAAIHRVDLLGNPVSDTPTLQGHHDFLEVEPGRFAWLGYDMRTVPAPTNDFDLPAEICIAADTVYEGDEGGTDEAPTEIWNAWDPVDYPPGIFTIPEGSVNCGADGCEPSFLKNGCYEFGHGNSLAYVASEDAYYTNWRWLDLTMKIARDGALNWQWGGVDYPSSDLAPAGSAEPFDGSHFSDVWSGGMMMFDNRDRTKGSRLVEYTFDDTSYDEAWTYEEPTGAYENLLGDVQRIPGCDNLLVSWSGQAKIQEITRDGEVVWEVVSPVVGAVSSRLYFVPDLYDLSGVAFPDE